MSAICSKGICRKYCNFRHWTCKVNKTATFKKIFKTIETNESVAYSNLPEDTIAEKIYKLRMIKGCTQREFAKMCSIGYSSLCKYELGFNPSIKNLNKISNTFNIDIGYFLK
ncbi:helix-turn-helix domain-containing protein [Clostridium sporogenes]|uniref:helix-turn-helix domain-containing protein n=1 Tax=Clostridium sporogenes TaxID=1509 RepID=UPI001F3ED0D2|nr:helix-turn-helix transcriptional regulator [Clostridium sporogenes]UJA30833.1 helix-turn-helix domain-containing protein [Clostridium sporogenes]